MSKIDTGHSELSFAFKSHKNVTGISSTHNMVLFYAVECGLKAMICSSKFGNRPKRISDIVLNNNTSATTHRINDLINHLKLPASVGKCPDVKINRYDKSFKVQYSDLHQAWRYGVKLDSTLEAEAVSWLQKMITFIESKI